MGQRLRRHGAAMSRQEGGGTPIARRRREIFFGDFFNFCQKGVPNATYSAFWNTFLLKNHQNGAPNAIYSALWGPLGAKNPNFEFWVFGVACIYFKIATTDFLQISIETLSTTFRSRLDLVLIPRTNERTHARHAIRNLVLFSFHFRVCTIYNEFFRKRWHLPNAPSPNFFSNSVQETTQVT